MDTEEIRKRIDRIGEDEKPESLKFSVKYMDSSVDPNSNFYKFCNGKWIDTHPIPDDKIQWSAFMELSERNRYVLGKIVEDCAFYDNPDDPIKAQVGAFYLSAMDTLTIERLKFEPIREFVELIEKIKDSGEIILTISKLHGKGISAMFSYSSDSDEKDSSTYAYYLKQGGLSLPNRDYYFLEPFEDIRKDFKRHVANIFVLYGYSEEDAKKSSDIVFDTEVALAKASRTPVELRDPEKNYNRFELRELEQSFPNVNIKRYLSEVQLPPVKHVVVRQPEFFENLEKMLDQIPLSSWKVYLIWKILNFASPYLHEEVANEHFYFFERKLFGRKKQEKRWKRVVNLIDGEIGEALGKLYVDQEFGEESKRRMEVLINDLKNVFADKLDKSDWMSDKTKKMALEKFSKFRSKIGYPTKFIDYSSIRISPDDLFGNILRSEEFEFEREIRRINSPVDKELWQMTPPTVNAYFSPTENEIVFPAGILQPPFFDPNMDDAVNYGATGGVIAHEITHGFDDEGRKYDLNGNLNDWWSPEDIKEFSERAKSVANLYGSLEALPGLHVNGELTLGENIADLGGVSIAFEALEKRLNRDSSLRKNIDGLTPEQRFYIAWSQSWRANVREEAIKWQVSNDPHSPDNLRGEVPARVHYAFASHFKGPDGTKKKQDTIISIW